MEREDAITELLHDIRGVVACHQSSSIPYYPAAAELESFFALRRTQSIAPLPKSVEKPPKTEIKPPAASVVSSDYVSLREIAAEVQQCRSCGLSKNRTTGIAGNGGGKKIRLFIIGHWTPALQETNVQTVFGVQEDQMLARMLTAINLSMEEVYISNVIKCGVGPTIQPQGEHITACASFLQRQIRAASPDIICTMGMVATRTLLNLPQPLSALRGRFYDYRVEDGVEIPLLPTYHPGYLLQNDEMKKPTWLDLQRIQKRLGE